ncbi:MAG: four helix bundle protein [Candidatus Roizmanbacteria bacterium]
MKDQSQVKNPKTELKYRAFRLSIALIRFLTKLPRDQASKVISDQLIRSSTSIGANIVEAKSSSSKKEFMHYFQISLKSANESKYWLALLYELYPSQKDTILGFSHELEEISRIIGSSILTMKGKRSL